MSSRAVECSGISVHRYVVQEQRYRALVQGIGKGHWYSIRAVKCGADKVKKYIKTKIQHNSTI